MDKARVSFPLPKAWRYAVLAVAAFSAFVFTPSFRGEFVYDEATSYYQAAPLYTSYAHAFSPPIRFDAYFRPFPLMTGITELRLSELVSDTPEERERAFRAIGSVDNYILHGLNTVLVFAFVLVLLGGTPCARWGALFAAAWFGLHPIHTEVAGWRGGHTDLVTTATWLGSTLVAMRFWRGGSRIWVALSSFMFLLALLSKENAASHVVILPILLWAYDRISADGGPPDKMKRALWLGVGGAAALTAYAVLRGIFFNFSAPYSAPPTGVGVFDMIRVLALYLAKMVVPWPQSPYIATLPSSLYTGATLCILCASLLGCWYWKKFPRPVLVVGSVWAVISVLPGLVYLLRPAGTVVATERILYIPTVGVALLVGCLFGLLMENPSWRKPVLAVSAAVLVAYGVGSVAYARTFATEREFWTAASRHWGGDRDKYVLVSLGEVYINAGEYRQASDTFRRSLEPESMGTWQPMIRRRFDIGASLGYLRAQAALAEAALSRGDIPGAQTEAGAALALLPALPIADVAGRDPAFANFIGLNHFFLAEAQFQSTGWAVDSHARALKFLESAGRMGWRDPMLQQRIQICRVRLANR